jgi:hypothetical protein
VDSGLAHGALEAATGFAHRASDVLHEAVEKVDDAVELLDEHKHPAIAATVDAAGGLGAAAASENPELAVHAVLEFVGRMGFVGLDHLVERFVQDEGGDFFAARRRGQSALKRMVARGYLETRPVVVPAIGAAARKEALPDEVVTRVYYLSQHAALTQNLPLPPNLREAFIPHYLKTMEAMLEVERQLKAEGNTVLSFKGEEALVREEFKGKLFRRGAIVPKFPDGVLHAAGPDGSEFTVSIEYVTRSYTDEMIAEKKEAFSGRVVWAVDRESTAARVQDVAGPNAEVMIV